MVKQEEDKRQRIKRRRRRRKRSRIGQTEVERKQEEGKVVKEDGH